MSTTIFLINQISKHGHLDMYARVYSASLLELGYRVVLIAEHEGGVREWLADRCGELVRNFTFFERQQVRQHENGPAVRENDTTVGENGPAVRVPAVRPPLLQRVRRIWGGEGVAGMALRCYFYSTKPFRKLDSIITQGLARMAAFTAAGDARTAAGDGGDAGGIGFDVIVEEIRIASTRIDVRPALIFFLYLDMMSDSERSSQHLAERLGVPWAGILFHPRGAVDRGGAGAERYFCCENSRGAAFLNPHLVAAYKRRFPRLQFGVLPDVTDAATSPQPSKLVQLLGARAAGRKIVLLSGSLAPHKGLVQLIEVVSQADAEHFFFAIVGEVFWESFGPDMQKLRRFSENVPENCMFWPSYIEDERELNSLIAAVDILYAVYEEFPDSSNTLTKAAIFEKPLLVSKEYLMGERVMRYRLGETVAYGDVSGILAALEKLRNPDAVQFGFAIYRQEHSLEALKEGLHELVTRWISTDDGHVGEPAVENQAELAQNSVAIG
jgi:hypothetical protein